MADPDLPLVIGIGNEDRCDDGVGPRVARLVLARLGTSVRVAEVPGPITDLLDLWCDAGDVYVIDALQSGEPAGSIRRILVGEEPIPSRLGATSTHGLSLSDAIALGESLGCRPRRLVVYGVEAASLANGTSLTSEVERSVATVADRLTQEIAARARRD